MRNSITFERGPGLQLTICHFSRGRMVVTVVRAGTKAHLAYASVSPDDMRLCRAPVIGGVNLWCGARAAFHLSVDEAARVAEKFGMSIEEIDE